MSDFLVFVTIASLILQFARLFAEDDDFDDFAFTFTMSVVMCWIIAITGGKI